MPPIPLFEGIDPAVLGRLHDRAVERRFDILGVLHDHGDPDSEVLAIVDGRVKIWRGLESGLAITLGLLGPGDFIGLTGALAGLPRRSHATALTPVTVLIWPGSVIAAEIGRDARLGMNVNRLMAHYLRGVAARMEELATPSADRRLARVLVGLLRGRGPPTPEPIGLRQSDLAELAQTTVPTVSRCVTRWRTLGVVATGRGHIRVLDHARLVGIGRGPG